MDNTTEGLISRIENIESEQPSIKSIIDDPHLKVRLKVLYSLHFPACQISQRQENCNYVDTRTVIGRPRITERKYGVGFACPRIQY
nr:hypothetical protein [Nanoarchaeum sp.]